MGRRGCWCFPVARRGPETSPPADPHATRTREQPGAAGWGRPPEPLWPGLTAAPQGSCLRDAASAPHRPRLSRALLALGAILSPTALQGGPRDSTQGLHAGPPLVHSANAHNGWGCQATRGSRELHPGPPGGGAGAAYRQVREAQEPAQHGAHGGGFPRERGNGLHGAHSGKLTTRHTSDPTQGSRWVVERSAPARLHIGRGGRKPRDPATAPASLVGWPLQGRFRKWRGKFSGERSSGTFSQTKRRDGSKPRPQGTAAAIIGQLQVTHSLPARSQHGY